MPPERTASYNKLTKAQKIARTKAANKAAEEARNQTLIEEAAGTYQCIKVLLYLWSHHYLVAPRRAKLKALEDTGKPHLQLLTTVTQLTAIVVWLAKPQSQKQDQNTAADDDGEDSSDNDSAAKPRSKSNKRAAESSPPVSENEDIPQHTKSRKRQKPEASEDEDQMETEPVGSSHKASYEGTQLTSPQGKHSTVFACIGN